MPTNAGNRYDEVRSTLSGLISGSEALLAAIGEEGAQRYREAVVGLQRQVRNARDQADDLQYAAVRRARVAARHADDYVRDNPWKTAGAAVIVGAAIGIAVALVISQLFEASDD
jgi:ElaB/YqjD/DUF883 family membrane-anchored ribosome-binding protein